MKNIFSHLIRKSKKNELAKPITPPRLCMVEHFGEKARCLTVKEGMAVQESDKHIWVTIYDQPEKYERSKVWFVKKTASLLPEFPTIDLEHANGCPAPEGHRSQSYGK